MLLRFGLLFSLASLLLIAHPQQSIPDCCEREAEKLSQQQVKALLQKAKPIHAPCCADMLHISGTVVLAIAVDHNGDVSCIRVVSGHPLITGVAMESVKEWKFRPYTSKGFTRSFCGRVALRYQANENAVKYRVI
jgi:outer membrane biosynthesis protein TonB